MSDLPRSPDQTVAVVGLGKIGLPLAVQFARSGLQVIGIDIDETVIATINDGHAPFPGEAHLEEYLRDVVDGGRLNATSDAHEAVSEARTIVLVVPLIVDASGTPDFRAMDAATQNVGHALQPETLVLYETTLPVHTTRQRFAPALEQASGLTCGTDFHVAFSPERVYSGRIFSDLRRYPKLVGGLDVESTRRAIDFYEIALQFDDRDDLDAPNGVWDLGSAEAAELSKLAETTYRDINIAFANELAIFSESAGIDVFKVITAANSQPFSHLHHPGVAVGGHCIPVYPRLFLSNAPDAKVPATARSVNERVPAHAVATMSEHLGGLNGRRIAVLGAAYRGGVKETAFSGVFPLVAELRRVGAIAMVHDPLYTDDELTGFGFHPYHVGDPVDAAIVQSDHDMYRRLAPTDLPGIEMFYDGRNITDPERWRDLGVMHHQLGRGERPASAHPLGARRAN